jgi:3-oxoacyl-[acyl-carrier-protein] synthase-3
VLFGDAAAAVVVSRHDDPAVGFGQRRLHTDGAWVHLIEVKGVGFLNQPWVDEAQLQSRLHWPSMSGAELFRQASTLMPAAVEEVVADAGLTVDDLDVVIAHQANARIIEAARKRLGVAEEVVPINIDHWGNTTAATLPLLWHELESAGRVPSGATVAFTAFGSGVHWGALFYRHP